MRIFFLGAEQPVNVRLLLDNGAEAMGLSYSALVRRSGGKPRTALADRFPEKHELLLDSGGYQANSKAQTRSRSEWERYATDYVEFVLANLERCTLVTEFDFLGLGPDWLEEMRRGVWREVADEGRFLPVWHPEQGIAALEVTAERFGRVGVVGNVLTAPGQTAATQLIRLARQGIEVHGLGLTKMELCETIPFTSVASTSWISPMKDGDVIVYDGRTLHRYPKGYAEQGRKRHRMWIEHNGFDSELWGSGDKREALQVCIWSWLEWSKALGGRHHINAAPRPGNSETAADDEEFATVTQLEVHRRAPKERELVDLPLFGFEESSTDNENGERELLPVISSTTVRVCDSCFLAPGSASNASQGCPSYEPGAVCAFKFPVKVETKGERKAVANGALAMQFQRVSFMRMNEELSGGYADPNLSQEIDRLVKMMATIAEIEDDRDFFEMTVRAKGGNQGVMSRLFGNQVGSEASRVERPLSAVETDMVIAGETVGRFD